MATGGEPRLPDPRPPDLLASDGERDQVVAHLGDACAAGRLTLGEFEERVGLALEARTHGELDRLVADLPASPAAPAPAVPAAGQKKKWTVTVLSGHSRKGRWTLPGHSVYLTLLGGVELDLSEAEISGPEMTVTVVSILGGADIRIPSRVRTEVSGFNLLGGKEVDQQGRTPAGAPTVHFKLFPILGGISVRSRAR